MEKPEKEKVKSHLKHIPKDAQVIMSIMKDMDITDYEPRVINQLLEFTYRYVTCILDDSRIFANHAKKKTIDLDDVKLARDVMLERSFTTPPSREILLNIARTKNNCPLPLIKPHAGLRLPPDRYCLSACNYKLKPSSAAKKVTKSNASFTNPASIKVQNKPVTIPVMKRSGTFSTIPKTQTVNIPKPVFKFSTTAQQKSISKPKIQVTGNSSSLQQSQQMSTPSALGTIKLEPTIEEQGIKRKFEDVSEDYDI